MAQHRRLPAAGLPEEGDELPLADADVDAGEGERVAIAGLEALRHPAQLDLRLPIRERAAHLGVGELMIDPVCHVR
jgi:hypothetical protein